MNVLKACSAVTLTLVALMPPAQAAVTGSASIEVDWTSVSLTGVTMTPSSYADPSDGYAVSSSYTYGDTSPFTESADYNYYLNGSPFEITTGPGPVQVTAGFAGTTNYATADISSAGGGSSSGMAWNGTGYIYSATSSGTVNFAIDYALAGMATIGGGSEYIGVGYEVYLYMWDVDIFADDFETLYASNGGDYYDAYRQANDNAFIIDDYFAGTILNCSTPGACSASQAGTFTTSPLAFAVQAGKNYGMEVYVQVTANAYSTVVPVPNTAWLFGSALLGLSLISRRRQALNTGHRSYLA